MNRKLIIDAQIFQTPAWHRGMGKYSLELLNALSNMEETYRWSSIEILLSRHNKLDKISLELISAKIPDAKIIMLDLSPNDFRNKKIIDQNRKIIDAYIDALTDSKREIDYLILSIMQREIFPAFPSDNDVKKFLLFYDLIPLMLHDKYLIGPVNKAEYLSKLTELLRADKYFAISKTVANDLAVYLGIDKNRIINIDGGPIEHSNSAETIRVPTPFILMPTGNDPRKNNRRAILGFNEFNKIQAGKYSLVITSFFSEKEIKELREISENIHFTGNINGQELSYLYENSTAVLFPSEHEGLGLPILEAVEKNKPVACSNISVFREMSETAFSYFEPRSIIGIEQALKSAIASSPNIREYKDILDKYSWNNTAQKLSQAITKTSTPNSTAVQKPKYAVFGPNPTYSQSAGKLMQECHGELSRSANISYYLSESGDDSKRRINYLPFVTKCRKISERFSFSPNDYEATIYHISNNPECAEILLVALAVPGIVVLHDTDLTKVWEEIRRRNLISQNRYDLELAINDTLNIQEARFIASMINIQKTIVVFSKHQKSIVSKVARQTNPKLNVVETNLPLGNQVYPDPILKRTINVGEVQAEGLIGDGSLIYAKTDLQYDETISKMKVVVFENGATKYEVTSSMRFGTIPCLPAKGWHSDLDDSIALKYKPTEKAIKVANTLLSDESGYLQTTENISHYVDTDSMKTFIKKLQAVIGKV